MTRNIGTTAVIDQVRFEQQMSHPAAPSAGYELLYVVSGSSHGGLYVQDSGGRKIGPFITGSTAGGGGGTLIKSAWSADAPPSSAGSEDDEFTDGSGGVPGGWTEFDPNSKLLIDESSTYNAVILSGTSTAYDLVGMFKTIPAGDFTIWTGFEMLGSYANYWQMGLALWENATGTTGKIMSTTIVTQADGNSLFVSYPFTNYQSQGAASFSIPVGASMGGYFRIRRIGTDYFHGFSRDGIHWGEWASAINPAAFTPSHFGVYMVNNNTTVNQAVLFKFFRYLNYDIGRNGIVPGRSVGIYV